MVSNGNVNVLKIMEILFKASNRNINVPNIMEDLFVVSIGNVNVINSVVFCGYLSGSGRIFGSPGSGSGKKN